MLPAALGGVMLDKGSDVSKFPGKELSAADTTVVFRWRRHPRDRSAAQTCSTCASVSSGYMGRLTTSRTATLVTRHLLGPRAMRSR